MFGNTCSLCGTKNWAYLRMDGKLGQTCHSCSAIADKMRAEYREKNPDADFRWAIDEKRELKAKYDHIREHLDKEEERRKREIARMEAEWAEYERQQAEAVR